MCWVITPSTSSFPAPKCAETHGGQIHPSCLSGCPFKGRACHPTDNLAPLLPQRETVGVIPPSLSPEGCCVGSFPNTSPPANYQFDCSCFFNLPNFHFKVAF